MRAIIYSARNETDGLITKSALNKISTGIPNVTAKALTLIEVGRWIPNDGGGWWIHHFLEFNPSKAQLSEQRVKNRERKQKSRVVSRRDSAVTDASPRSGRESLSLETEKNAEIAKPTWMRLGMSRDEWMAAGRPERETG